MNKIHSASKIELKNFDDLFRSSEECEEGIREIPISELFEFKKHPYKIHETELADMIESIRQFGVLVPGICRPRTDGGYEILAGHTRREACRQAGLVTMPMLVKNVNDDDATIIMVDSNIQRENVLVSEKSKAYKMRYDAMKHQGVKGNSLKTMHDETGESEKQIQRYLWLSRLDDELLALMDEKKLPMTQGVDISFLGVDEQRLVLEAIQELHLIPTMLQTAEIKNCSQKGILNRATLMQIIKPVSAKKPVRKVTFKADKLDRYFDDDVSDKEIAEIIIQLLDEWKEGKKDER